MAGQSRALEIGRAAALDLRGWPLVTSLVERGAAVSWAHVPSAAVVPQQELIDAFETTFAACRRAGIDVFITTSHSGPYESSSDEARYAMVDAWAKSDNVG